MNMHVKICLFITIIIYITKQRKKCIVYVNNESKKTIFHRNCISEKLKTVFQNN